MKKADIQPVDSNIYMTLKKLVNYYLFDFVYTRQQIQQAEKTKYTAGHLKSIPTQYKPVSIHKEYVSIIFSDM